MNLSQIVSSFYFYFHSETLKKFIDFSLPPKWLNNLSDTNFSQIIDVLDIHFQCQTWNFLCVLPCCLTPSYMLPFHVLCDSLPLAPCRFLPAALSLATCCSPPYFLLLAVPDICMTPFRKQFAAFHLQHETCILPHFPHVACCLAACHLLLAVRLSASHLGACHLANGKATCSKS